MYLQKLYEEALSKWYNGYSQSRLVDFVFENANNAKQAEIILTKIFKEG